LLDLPKIPPPAVQDGSDRNPHATDSHQGPPGPRFQSPRGPPGPGKKYLSYFMKGMSWYLISADHKDWNVIHFQYHQWILCSHQHQIIARWFMALGADMIPL
jgi:hypothetical protein